MSNTRREDGFNLSFLDVMACGLGAVLLLLILVRFQDNTRIPSDELERLQQELAAVQSQQSDLEQSLSVEQQNTAARSATLAALKRRLEDLKIEQQGTTAALRNQLAVVADLENAIAATAPETANDPITTAETQEEQYLLGLKVEGRRIGILIDSSASMTEEGLIDIISRKLGTETEKKAGKKWQRTLRITRWLLARLPQQSDVTVVSFNNTATTLGNKNILKAARKEDLQAVNESLVGIVPQNGTNLLAGLREITRAMPNMTDLYLITDGLPSILARSDGFSRTRGCNPVEGQQSTISGECRLSVFAHSLRLSSLGAVKTNVILLPLEGDPQAPAAYWNWANTNQGVFLAPASSWP